jgi:acetoin utilization protein AcuB
MNVFAPVSTLMTDHHKLVTVSPEDNLVTVKKIFDTHRFHHLPVVHFREIVGLISRTDFDHFMGGSVLHKGDQSALEPHLENTKASDLMTTRLGKLESTDRINVALEIFNLNRFHALPVVDDGELVGIITPFDILKALSEEKLADPSSIYDQPH